MKLFWNRNNTPKDLHPLLSTLAEEYPIAEGKENVNLLFEKSSKEDFFSVAKDSSGVFRITYSSTAFAGRGVGLALAGLEGGGQFPFSTFGILLDCTRSAVVKGEHFKKWLRRLALLGYNMAMLYTKDCYTLPGEPYFGYMRGPYTLEELQEIDDYAAKLGIEMTASIQALGHLEPILRWGAYAQIKDTDNVLLADHMATYDLLEKMLQFWSDAFRSRRIHLGMDETHDLGRGRFMDLNGYEKPFSIYSRHLKKLEEMCEQHSFQPMIWSDMYFRYANKHQSYYDISTPVPEEILATIPQKVQFAFWDYYHREEEVYKVRLEEQKKFNPNSSVMASGIWTWVRLWTDYEESMATITPCLSACRKTGTKEIIFTMWGDDGNYCEFDSAFGAVAWAAEKALTGDADIDEARMETLFSAICGTSYALQKRAGDLDAVFPDPRKDKPQGAFYKIHGGPLLWDDPLMGILWHEYLAVDKNVWENAIAHYKKLREELAPHREDTRAGHINHAWLLADILTKKLELRRQLLASYKRRDYDTLEVIIHRYIPELLDTLDALLDSFRLEWMRSYKTWGFEVVQIKIAGLAERYRELSRRIEELLDGTASEIAELEINPQTRGDIWETRYRMIATGSWFI